MIFMLLLLKLIVRVQTYFSTRVKQLHQAAAKRAEKEKAKKDAEKKDGSSENNL
jgi:Tfp pilus assembly protein PilO